MSHFRLETGRENPKAILSTISSVDYPGVSGYLPVQASGMRVASPRDLAFVIDSNGYRWARLMLNLLREICHAVNQSETGVLSEAECRRYRKRYRTILTQGGKELPEIPRRRKGKRGRVAKSFGHNLHDRLLKNEDSVLLKSMQG